jgi:hypothetical protein
MPKIGVFRAYIDVFDPEKDCLREKIEPRRTRRARRKTGLLAFGQEDVRWWRS